MQSGFDEFESAKDAEEYFSLLKATAIESGNAVEAYRLLPDKAII